jgi:hypothetical protein
MTLELEEEKLKSSFAPMGSSADEDRMLEEIRREREAAQRRLSETQQAADGQTAAAAALASELDATKTRSAKEIEDARLAARGATEALQAYREKTAKDMEAEAAMSHEGELAKYSVGSSVFGVSNWRTRYFSLRRGALDYYATTARGKQLGSVALAGPSVRLVTAPTLKTHKEAKHAERDIVIVFPLNGKFRTLLLRCHDAEEHAGWVAALRLHVDTVDAPQDYPASAAGVE